MKLKGWQLMTGVAFASVGAPAALYLTLAPSLLRADERVTLDLGNFGYADDGKGVNLLLQPQIKAEMKGLKASDKVLVVALGDCAQCAANAFHPGDENKKTYQRVIILLNGQIEKSKPKVDDTSRYRYTILPNGDYFKTVQAYIRPRLYIATGDGVILKAETSLDDRQEFLGK
jgi:hypothetical protein